MVCVLHIAGATLDFQRRRSALRPTVRTGVLWTLIFLMTVVLTTLDSHGDTLIVHTPSYQAQAFNNAPDAAGALALDSFGRIYVPRDAVRTVPGILRFTPDGNPTALWSTAPGTGIAITPAGVGYTASGGRIYRIAPDGSFQALPSSAGVGEWWQVALTARGGSGGLHQASPTVE